MASFAWICWDGAMPLFFEVLPFFGVIALASLIVYKSFDKQADSDEPLG